MQNPKKKKILYKHFMTIVEQCKKILVILSQLVSHMQNMNQPEARPTH